MRAHTAIEIDGIDAEKQHIEVVIRKDCSA
jgi:hypothetical protein